VGVLIDTSVLVAAERGRGDWEAVLDAGVDLGNDEPVAMAAITAAELLHGVHRLRGVRQARASRFVETLLAEIPVRPFDLAAARLHGMLSADLTARGIAVGPHDLLIAATAVALGYDVATRDMRSFARIKGLTVRLW
jgi:predicted nucleic acid-binding protein